MMEWDPSDNKSLCSFVVLVWICFSIGMQSLRDGGSELVSTEYENVSEYDDSLRKTIKWVRKIDCLRLM